MSSSANVIAINGDPVSLKAIEVDLETSILVDQAFLVKLARLKLSWFESFVYSCLRIEAKKQKVNTLTIDVVDFVKTYQFTTGKNLDALALTSEKVIDAIASIQRKEGLCVTNAPKTIQLQLF